MFPCFRESSARVTCTKIFLLFLRIGTYRRERLYPWHLNACALVTVSTRYRPTDKPLLNSPTFVQSAGFQRNCHDKLSNYEFTRAYGSHNGSSIVDRFYSSHSKRREYTVHASLRILLRERLSFSLSWFSISHHLLSRRDLSCCNVCTKCVYFY